MTDTTQVANEPARQEALIDTAQLAGNIFGIDVPKKEPAAAPAAAAPELPKEEPKNEPITPETPAVTNAWEKFGWKDDTEAEAEIKQLRELKDKKPQDLAFTNEESKKVFELLREGKIEDVVDIYSKQKAIDKLLAAEVTPDTAADIIKMSLKMKYPTLTDSQIDFQYRQEYGLPKEPVQGLEELDEDFADRLNAYKETVENVKMKATIAATMAKPDIEKSKTQIVLPEINGVPQLSQEELEKQAKYTETFLNAIQNSVKDFNGFSETVKHEGVDIAVSYGITDEEKATIATQFTDFVKSGYDANALLSTRWVNEDGTLKAEQMVKDWALLNNADKALKKFANDAAAKALENYIKGKKNISITPKGSQQVVELQQDGKSELDLVRDKIFGS